MNPIIENIRKYGNELKEAESNVESIKQTIEDIDNEERRYHASLELNFKGMYARCSKKIGVTNIEIKDILNNRLNEAIIERDVIIKKLNSLL